MSSCSNNSTALPAASITASNVTNGTNGNTILNGIIPPINSQGVNGDFFLNTATNTLYGPKAAGVWPAGVSLVGATGATGARGVTLLTNNIVVDTPSSGAYATLKSYSMPATTLTTNGDIIKLKFLIETAGTTNLRFAKLLIAGNDAMPSIAAANYLNLLILEPYIELNVIITRLSNTTVFISYSALRVLGTPWFGGDSQYSFYEASITVNDLTNNSNLIALQGFTTAPDTIVCKQLTAESIKI